VNESQMYPFRVYCNRSLIASFMTERLRDAFIAERKAAFPRNHYADYPIST
jgi:hypothetical protein